MTAPSDFLAALAAIVGEAHVLRDAQTLAPYCTDWRGRYHGAALAAVLPASTQEVAAIVRASAAHRVPIVPQGGNTSLCGASVPAEDAPRAIVLNTARMNRILAVDAENNTLTAQAGCTLAAAQQAAREAGRLFALSLASEGSCQIGGNLSTNAGGIQVLRYGNARELTLGLEVVLADGQIWDGLRALRKDNTGYDLKQLFIGAEGTLGIITAAVLKLHPLPTARAVGWLALESPSAALALLHFLRGHLPNASAPLNSSDKARWNWSPATSPAPARRLRPQRTPGRSIWNWPTRGKAKNSLTASPPPAPTPWRAV